MFRSPDLGGSFSSDGIQVNRLFGIWPMFQHDESDRRSVTARGSPPAQRRGIASRPASLPLRDHRCGHGLPWNEAKDQFQLRGPRRRPESSAKPFFRRSGDLTVVPAVVLPCTVVLPLRWMAPW